MRILGSKLTVDDLIVEYMIAKLKGGYEPSFSIDEFMTFLKHFESLMKVEDVLSDGEALFKRFFERKKEYGWNRLTYRLPFETVFVPHLTLNDGIIKPNYNFSRYDKTVINTYYMKENTVKEIRNIIYDYLEQFPARKLNMPKVVYDFNKNIGANIATNVVNNIWEGFLKSYKDKINDYNIDLTFIKESILKYYFILKQRIICLYGEDKNFEVSSCASNYLAYSNYLALINGYEKFAEFAMANNRDVFSIKIKYDVNEKKYTSDNAYKINEELGLILDDNQLDENNENVVRKLKIQ